MKNLIFAGTICLTSICANAQIIVDSLGKVTLGETTTTKLKINELLNSSGLHIYSNGTGSTNLEKSSLFIQPNFLSDARSLCGITATSSPSSRYAYGIGGFFSEPWGNNTMQGIGAGIYGSCTDFMVSWQNYPGTYAGFFQGDVRVTGSLYGTLLTPSSNSSSNSNASQESVVRAFSANSTGEESVSDKLQQVQLLQMYRPDANKLTAKQVEAKKEVFRKYMQESLSATDDEAKRGVDLDNIEVSDEIPQTRLSTVKYGLAADQLKEVYPELVYEDKSGNVSINYIEMIPLLVQAVNELKAENQNLTKEVALLKGETKSEAKTRNEATAINTVNEAVLSLAQNNPNPFSESTSIEVSVPQSVRSASLFIYDMSGKMLKRIAVTGRGTSRVPVTAEGLTEGMYLYTLIADGKVVGTKKMILAK